MTSFGTNTTKTAMGLIMGTAIAFAMGATTIAQAQGSSQGSFNSSFARNPGATDVLNRGARAQTYRERLAIQRMSGRTRQQLTGQAPESNMLRERGNMARHARHDVQRRQMFQRRYGIDAQRRSSFSGNRSTASRSSFSSGRSTVSRSSMRANGPKWRNWDARGTASRSSMRTNSARYTRSARSAGSLRSARTAASAARYARTARYARYATGAGAVAALAGVDPITMGIHAATNPKDFGRKASYYARNPHKGVEQMGRNVVNNTKAIGRGIGKGACGFGNIFKKKRNRSRCR